LNSDPINPKDADARGQGSQPAGTPAAIPSALGLVREGNPTAVTVLVSALVLTAYLPALRNGFVNLDDPGYIYGNGHLWKGLTLQSIQWAFTTGHMGAWHPLTWVSLLVDSQVFGARAWGYHATSVALHAANSALLFRVFRELTGATWRSAGIALLFGLHPLHVESVAWASERKDVLSALFWMLSLLLYIRYARGVFPLSTGNSTSGRSIRAYAFALGFFACGLMSKPMVVTLPFVLLLIDWWPLGRFHAAPPSPRISRLVIEKIPFFVLALICGLITIHTQHELGAVQSVANFPVSVRVANSLLSYVHYLVQIVRPGWAVYYPYPTGFSILAVGLAAVVLVLITVVAGLGWRRRPYLAMGWVWFVVTLLPVIGLVQVGHQSHADRYTYLPLIGIFAILVWGAHELASQSRFQVKILAVAGGLVAVLCFGYTIRQVGYWKDSTTLLAHSLAVTRDNEFARNNLGAALSDLGRLDEAIIQFEQAVRLSPKYVLAQANLGIALVKRGRLDEAIPHLQAALKFKPDYALALGNLGLALSKKGRTDEAMPYFVEAIRLKPDYAAAHRNLGLAFVAKGRLQEAIVQLQEAVRFAPEDAEARYNLGVALGSTGRVDEAINQYRQLLILQPGNADAHNNLGAMMGAKGLLEEAIAQFQEAVKLMPGNLNAQNNLRAALAAKANAAKPAVVPNKP
jgi:tetratricopeptide (TPR) repeat protein